MDTNVLLAALRSKKGASYRLLLSIGMGVFDIALSVPLVVECEDIAMRFHQELGLTSEDVDDILDYLCLVAKRQSVFFLWRPFLTDPKDDMLLELAIAASCETIVTFNLKDFAGVEAFGVRAITPGDFLKFVGVLP